MNNHELLSKTWKGKQRKSTGSHFFAGVGGVLNAFMSDLRVLSRLDKSVWMQTQRQVDNNGLSRKKKQTSWGLKWALPLIIASSEL